MKTWDDLEQLAIGLPWDQMTPAERCDIAGEPVLYATIRAVNNGNLTREQALIQAVFALVEVKNQHRKMLLDYMNTRPIAPIMVLKGGE